MNLKISTKISLIIVTSLIVVVLIFALIGNYLLSGELTRLESENQLREAKRILQETDVIISDRIKLLEAMALDRFAFIDYLTESGNVISQELVNDTLESLNREFDWNDLYLIDTDGFIVASSDSQALNNTVNQGGVEDIKIFNEVIKTKKTAYSDAFLLPNSSSVPEITMSIASPVLKDDEVIGLLTARIKWGEISQLFHQDLDRTYRLYNQRGILLYSSEENDASLIGVSDNQFDQRIDNTIKNNFARVQSDPHSNENVITSVALEDGFANYQGNNWLLVSQISVDTALANMRKIITETVAIASFSILIINVFVVLFINKLVLKPFSKLTEVSKAIASGDYTKKLNINSHDEAGLMAQSFNKMIKTIRDYQENLENKVKQRTKELADNVVFIKKQNIELKSEKEKVVNEKDKINLILKSIGDGVFVVDKNENLILVNNIAEKLSGFSQKDMLNKHYKETFRFFKEEKDGSTKEVDDFVAKTIQSGISKNMSNHTVIIQKNGTIIPVVDSAAPIKDSDDNVFGCVVVFRDFSKERAVIDSKDEFLSLASHQLKTPATAVKMWLGMVLEGMSGKITKKQQEYLEKANNNNENQIRIIEDLLNVSRADADRIVLQKKAVNLNNYLTDIYNDIKPTIEMNHKFKLQLSKKPITLSIDEERLKMAINNLINNASKYTPKGGTVKISLTEKAKTIDIEIKDSGIGIAKKDFSKLFNKFQRIENDYTIKVRGTGLGLYLANKIVELHDGKIIVESKVKQGSVFTISLNKKGK